MPPESEVIEAPKPAAKPPTAGDKFRAEFAKLKPTESAGEPAKPSEKPPENEALPAPPKEPEKVVIPEKPSSALDAAIGKEKPAPVKPEETPDILDLDEKKRPDDWARVRARIKADEGRIGELSAEVSRLKAEPKVDNKAIEQLTQERDQLKERFTKQEESLKALNAEYSEDFQKLQKDREGVVSKISSRMKAYGGDPETLVGALALPDGKFKTQQIKAALGELEDTDDRASVRALIESLDQVDEKIIDFKKDLPAKFEELKTRRDAQLREEQANNLKTLEAQFGAIVAELPKDSVFLREVPEDVAGAAEWNAEIREAREQALVALKPNGANINETVAIAVKGRRYDALEKRFLALHKEHSEAMARLREFDEGSPDFKGSSRPSTTVKRKPTEKFNDAMRAHRAAED